MYNVRNGLNLTNFVFLPQYSHVWGVSLYKNKYNSSSVLIFGNFEKTIFKTGCLYINYVSGIVFTALLI